MGEGVGVGVGALGESLGGGSQWAEGAERERESVGFEGGGRGEDEGNECFARWCHG